jgi:SagB-type dehydrogenase family enzyme
MPSKLGWTFAAFVLSIGFAAAQQKGAAVNPPEALAKSADQIALPAPAKTGRMSFEEALVRRHSVREFSRKLLTEQQLGQLLWAAQGITRPEGKRTAPSAGALYPLEIYVATLGGFFHYDPRSHRLNRLSAQDLRGELSRAALGQESVRDAAAVFVVAAVIERTARKYGPVRAPRYVHIEVGHAAQNLLLQAVALDLAAVPVGAFHDEQVQKALSLPKDHEPLYLIPVGYPR